jgi:hypothetical protein
LCSSFENASILSDHKKGGDEIAPLARRLQRLPYGGVDNANGGLMPPRLGGGGRLSLSEFFRIVITGV